MARQQFKDELTVPRGRHSLRFMNSIKKDRFGGTLFLVAGISFGASAALFFLADVLAVQNVTRVAYSVLALFFLAGLGCPSALASQTPPAGSFDRWVLTLATVGLAVGLVDSVRGSYLGTLLPWPAGFPSLLKRTDPLGLVTFPAIGLWVLVSSRKLRRLAPPRRGLGYLGVACGLLLFVPPITETLGMIGWKHIVPVFGVVVLLMFGMVLLWFGGVGFLLLRTSAVPLGIGPAKALPEGGSAIGDDHA
jgi:hypothetical protein